MFRLLYIQSCLCIACDSSTKITVLTLQSYHRYPTFNVSDNQFTHSKNNIGLEFNQ